jgi:hypothetical protein
MRPLRFVCLLTIPLSAMALEQANTASLINELLLSESAVSNGLSRPRSSGIGLI